MPLIRRIPKRGFTFTPKVAFEVVNLDKLNGFAAGTEINPEVLKKARLVNKKNPQIKILGDGSLKHAVNVKAHAFSKTALEKIKKAGGTALVLAKTFSQGSAKS